jgi:hypothetical protein
VTGKRARTRALAADQLPVAGARAAGEPPVAGTRVVTRVRAVIGVGLLVAGLVAWAAVPMSDTAAGTQAVLVATIGCAVFSVLRLALGRLAEVREPASSLAERSIELYQWPGGRLWQQLRAAEGVVPWAQLLIIGVLALEALHPARPWHTALLAVLLTGYLLALHLAETSAPASVFRPQLPLLAAGLSLVALSVGAAALPAGGASGGSGWLAVLAAVAAVIVAGLALPV